MAALARLYVEENSKVPVYVSKKLAALCWKWASHTN